MIDQNESENVVEFVDLVEQTSEVQEDNAVSVYKQFIEIESCPNMPKRKPKSNVKFNGYVAPSK